MKVISFVSFKGGAGKTTALMAMTSIMIELGLKVRLIEADENAPLNRWRENALVAGHWHANVDLARGDELDALESAMVGAEDEGFDFVLADTAGGGSELNVSIIANSDLVIVPTSLSVLDLDEAISTLEFIEARVARALGQDVPTRLLLTRHPQSRLKSSEAANLEAVATLPRLDHHLTERAAFADLKLHGLMGEYYKTLSSTRNRLLSTHVVTAMAEAREITKETLSII